MRAYALYAAVAVLAAGCTSTTPEWDRRFGQSMRTATAQQARSAAPAAAAPDGMDGKSAEAVMHRYRHAPAARPADPATERR